MLFLNLPGELVSYTKKSLFLIRNFKNAHARGGHFFTNSPLSRTFIPY